MSREGVICSTKSLVKKTQCLRAVLASSYFEIYLTLLGGLAMVRDMFVETSESSVTL